MKQFNNMAATVLVAASYIASAWTSFAGKTEISYAVEDAAYQAVMQMATDSRVNVKKIAFAKLMKGKADIAEFSEMAIVFENGLVQAPTEFGFLTHQNHVGEWTEIDRFFDAATDFADYDSATLPKVGVFKMAEAFVIGQVVDMRDVDNKASVRISLRLVRVDTAECLWAGTVEGVCDDRGPDYQMVDEPTRKAINIAVKEACEDKTLSQLADYQLLVLPFEGPLGRAVTQAFIKKISENASVSILDMPNDTSKDRMLSRFLRDRTGINRQISNSLLKRITTDIGTSRSKPGGKVAVLRGAVTTLDVTKASSRVKLGFDAKFLDINEGFKIIASATGFANHRGTSLGDQMGDFFSSWANIFIVLGAVFAGVILTIVLILKFRVR